MWIAVLGFNRSAEALPGSGSGDASWGILCLVVHVQHKVREVGHEQERRIPLLQSVFFHHIVDIRGSTSTVAPAAGGW